jgi:hypothetical protein
MAAIVPLPPGRTGRRDRSKDGLKRDDSRRRHLMGDLQAGYQATKWGQPATVEVRTQS